MSDADIKKLRVAVVHEWIQTYAGSERVVEQILQVLPQADVFSLVDFCPPSQRQWLGGRPVHTSYIQRLPFARGHFRKYLPLWPHAIEQLDLTAYDLVVSSSHAVAKGVLTSADQLHVCLCHSPMRYAWDLYHDYLRGSGLTRGLRGLIATATLHYLRLWDLRTANGVDQFVAVSNFIARRIRKIYRRRSQVIHPPVSVTAFSLREDKEDFYLAASRMVPYKRMDLIVQAFGRMPQRRLVVIGDGQDFAKVRALAGPNVTLLGYQDHASLVDTMQRARAFVFAAKEDFGIMPVEAQACGTPVIALAHGGCTETVLDGRTGVLFPRQTADDIVAAVDRFESNLASFSPSEIRANAERFSEEKFRTSFATLVQRKWNAFERQRNSKRD